MALEKWEITQRQKGNNAAADIARILRDNCGDVPIEGATSEELDSPRRFSLESRQNLEKMGFNIYKLTGKSAKIFRGEGRALWFAFSDEIHKQVLEQQSIKTEAAIHHDIPYIPHSASENIDKQKQLIAEFLKGEQGVKAVMGDVSDYMELYFLHHDRTKEGIFEHRASQNDEQSLFFFARTKTLANATVPSTFIVGGPGNCCSIFIADAPCSFRSVDIMAIPLLVPAPASC